MNERNPNGEEYCAGCGFKFEKSEMLERKEKDWLGRESKKWYCLRCASRF